MTMWIPNKVDLFLSVLIAVLFPFLAQILLDITGAFLPLLLYYGLAWGIVKIRRGSTGYFNPLSRKIPVFFIINMIVTLITLIFAYLARLVDIEATNTGILITALIWAPINAASEQLLWIYIYESWDLYPNVKKKISRSIGFIMFTVYVGLIHMVFWSTFLHTVDPASLFGILFIISITISGYIHILVWKESNQMIFTFIPHFLLNLIPIFWTRYSMVPYLFK
ncbi:MAG: hypothetical protein INQ03_17195 [Candidatus Heimdallarchaeota archaeon]|nr:hypothetical protein [Candidatus Heimdallarchaeota archaeon]